MIGPAELNRLAREGQVSDRAQEKDYVLTWLLAALTSLGPKQLVFKGGTALRRCYIVDYRYSEDLDFTLLARPAELDLTGVIGRWSDWIREVSGIACDLDGAPMQDATSFRAYIGYTGPLGASGSRRTIKIDANSDEVIRTPVENRDLISPYSDLQQPAYSVGVYSLVEIWAEKVRSLIQRTEPRDLYDLAALLEFDARLPEDSVGVYIEKLRDKNIDPARLEIRLREAETSFARLWENRLRDQIAVLPHFNEVWRRIRRAFREAGYLD